jgi:membrane-associated phospholipid phosphatase
LVVTLLRYSESMVPAEHRAWARALRTEADEITAGWSRLTWLAGGVRFTFWQAALNRRMVYPLAFAAAATGMAWSAWSGPPGDSAIVINRVDVITISVILAGLPWAVRRACGPIASSRQARMIRIAGYAAILVLVLVKAAVERVADAPPNNLDAATWAWTGEIAFLAVMVGYAAMILVYTASRSPAIPATVAMGLAAGVIVGVLVYLLGPLGFPLRFTGWRSARLYDTAMALGSLVAVCAPLAAGLAAARRVGSMSARSRTRQGAMAGLCAGTATALVVAALSTATIALLPYDAGLRNWAAGHVGQWTSAVGQVTSIVGVRLGYVAGNSAFAAGYLVVLLVSPLAGCGLGAWAGRSFGRPCPSRPGQSADGPAILEPLAGTSPSSSDDVARLQVRYGRPLLGPAARRRSGVLLTCCVILVAALGLIFAHQTTADWLDHAVDSPIINWLDRHPGLAVWLAFPGSQRPAIALTAVIVVACLLSRRLNGAVLAALAVPAAVGVNDGLCKPLFHRAYVGVLSYPSGHTATMFALGATVTVLLYAPVRPVRARALRTLIPAAACVPGGVVAIGVIGLRWHYFTDTVAGAAVGIGTVCSLALLLDLPSWLRRPNGPGPRKAPGPEDDDLQPPDDGAEPDHRRRRTRSGRDVIVRLRTPDHSTWMAPRSVRFLSRGGPPTGRAGLPHCACQR